MCVGVCVYVCVCVCMCVCVRSLENGTWVPEEARQPAESRAQIGREAEADAVEWLRHCDNIGEEANAVEEEERRNASGDSDRCSVSGKRRVKACGCSRSAICAQTPRL